MGYAVVHNSGMTKDAEFQEYQQLLTRYLLKREINLSDVPRISDAKTGKRWLYVWPTELEAKAFADQLNEEMGEKLWMVTPVVAPSQGPLRPLELQVGRRPDGWTFALAPWTRKVIQREVPGSCRNRSVFVAIDPRSGEGQTKGSLRELAGQVLPLLVGQGVELIKSFGEFVVTDPVAKQDLVFVPQG